MKQYFNVRGSMESVKPLEFNVDTIYSRSNIQRIETEEFVGWQYDEIQYTYEEYMKTQFLNPHQHYNQLDINSTPLEELKQAKKAQLDCLCTQTILGRFEVELNDNTYEFSNDTEAQLRFTGIGVMFMDNKINEIEWTTYLDGQRMRITLSKSEFDLVAQSALQHQNTNIIRYNQLLPLVDACTTNEEVDAINW